MTKILIADDHQVVIDGLRSMLIEEPGLEVVAEAYTGKHVLEILEETPVDLILLDINMPVMDGLEACKAIKKAYPDIQILALTMYNEGSFISGMLQNGASGYILKNTAREELLEAVKTVCEGETYFSKEVTNTMMTSMMKGRNNATQSFIPKLTRREKEILHLIVKERTTPEIADELCISIKTVETHRKNMLSKLNVRNIAGLVRIAVEKGLVD